MRTVGSVLAARHADLMINSGAPELFHNRPGGGALIRRARRCRIPCARDDISRMNTKLAWHSSN